MKTPGLALPCPCPGFFQGKGCLDLFYPSGTFWSYQQYISSSESFSISQYF